MKHSHYFKPVPVGVTHVDVYRVLQMFDVTCPALQHAAKKILVAGGRGSKDTRKDIQEAIDTLQRKLAMLDEDATESVVMEVTGAVACCGQHDTCSQPCVPRELARAGVDGWISWDGGKCPVPGDTIVRWRCRDGRIDPGHPGRQAKNLRWSHVKGYAYADIVAYRVVAPQP